MESILCQDCEYFDFHQAGVLQERLNSDTGLLAHQIIRQPTDLMAMLARVITKTLYMYTVSPRLFWITVSFPLPFATTLAYLSIEWIRKMHRKIHKVNDVAAAGTIDVLKEMTTVRQFAMEEKEHKRYSVTNLFRRILERRLATGTGLGWGMIGIIFWGTQLLVTYIGLRMILIHNSLTTSQLLICAINMHDIMWATRYICDLIPEMMKMLEPIRRVAQTLDSTPLIEPVSTTPLVFSHATQTSHRIVSELYC